MTSIDEPRRGRWLFRAAAALYVTSFVLPVYSVFKGSSPTLGYEVFRETRPCPDEWLKDPVSIIPNVAWAANIPMWLGCFWWVTGRFARTLVCGVTAHLLAVGGGAVYWQLFLTWPGYWAWLGSFVLLAAAGWRARPPTNTDDS